MSNANDDLGPDETYCSSCGEAIKEDAEICPECGVRQQPASGDGSLDVVDVLSDGFSRAFRRTGLILMGLFFGLQFLSQATSFSLVQTLMQRFGPDAMGPGGGFGGQANPFMGGGGVPGGITIPLPFPVLVVVGLALSVASVYLTLVLGRTLASDHAESIPSEYYQRNVVGGVLNLILAGIVTSIAIAIGFVLLIVPGIFLIISFAFVSLIVAVQDVNFIEAISQSWDMAKGNRVDILLIGAAIAVIVIVVSIISGIFSFLPVLNQLVTAVTQAFMTVFVMGVIAEAYLELGGETVE